MTRPNRSMPRSTARILTKSRALAGLIGPSLLAFGATLLINRPLFADMLAVAGREPLLVMLAGFLSFIAGIAIVRIHNVWQGWPALVTAFVCLVVGVILSYKAYSREE